MAEPDIAPIHHTPSGGKIGGFLGQQTAGLPNWAWLLIIVAGVGLAYVVPKFAGGKTGQSTGGKGEGLGLAIDPTTGLPYAVEGLVPSGGVVGTGGGGGGSITPDTPVTQSIPESGESGDNWQESYQSMTTGTSVPTPSPSMLQHATLRSKGSRPEIKSIDSRGIPVRDKPGGKEIRILPYKSDITISGTPVQGPKNLGDKGGSTLWYPVAGGGYVSKYDVGNFSTNSPGIRGWP
jgi:hypothetical protein